MVTVAFLLWPALASAQTNLGTDFWLADTIAGGGSANFAITVANPGNVAANVTIFNTIGGTTNGVVPAGDLTTFLFPRRNTSATGTFTTPVYHVTTDIDVTIYIFNPLQNVFTNDASLVLPVDSLGKNYRMGSYINPAGNTAGSFLGVVAASLGTTNIQTFNTAGALVDNVNLAQGQYFQRNNGNTVPSDVTVWRVVTDQPAAVFSGTQCTSILGTGACDHIEEQLIPEEALSNSYVACPTQTRPIGCTNDSNCTVDLFRFVAAAFGRDCLRDFGAVSLVTQQAITAERFG